MSEARSAAARLRRSGVTAVFRPLLLAARLVHHTDGQFHNALLSACERYAARVFVIGQRRSNTGQARLYRLAFEFYNGADRDYILDQIEALIWYHADDDVVRSGLSSNQQWYWRTQGHKYFLYEYELTRARRESDVHDFKTYADGSRAGRTTEHILTQNPSWTSGEWSAFFPDQHQELVHSIANLVLTDDNSSYGRKSFAAKKGTAGQGSPCYANSRLAQESDLAQLADWTPETMEARRLMLTEWALQRWPAQKPVAPATGAQAADADDDPVDEGDDDSLLGAAGAELPREDEPA